jgi:[ribosomal protein S5]-alanine N-acetyltransferase
VTDVVLLPATAEHLVALQTDRAALAAMIGSPAPDGWPEFNEAIGFTLDRLREHPHEAQWWMHFFLADTTLVGSGGFVGPPRDGVVEIGYEIAPEFRGNGLGTAAVRAMVTKARVSGSASMVIANTLAHENPSTGVLRRLGFRHAGARDDPEDGIVWRWELALTTR